MTPLRASIRAAALWGPGLEGWQASRPILAGETPYTPSPSPAPPPAILAATERRRAGPVIRLALAVAQEAALASGLAPGDLRTIFASSNGDGVTVGGILEALAGAAPNERVVSPTQFHNSVHNAPAGYWSIGHKSRQPATCLGAHDWTWPAALLKAMAELAAENEPVLLVCYDHPLPSPLDALRPTAHPFAAALVLTPPAKAPFLGVAYAPGPPDPQPPLPGLLQSLADGNAAARALPLLAALARNQPAEQYLEYLDAHLIVRLQP